MSDSNAPDPIVAEFVRNGMRLIGLFSKLASETEPEIFAKVAQACEGGQRLVASMTFTPGGEVVVDVSTLDDYDTRRSIGSIPLQLPRGH